MQNILDKTLQELEKELKPSYRAKQVFTWLHKKLTFDFDAMSDLSKELRSQLKEKYYAKIPAVKQTAASRDGTQKYLLELEDGHKIESVLLMDQTERKTVCVSIQAGCPLACAFCATGGMGFKRNLRVSEILGQVYRIAEENADISNLVFMGMGEPFLNYDNVMKAINILTSKEGPNFGQRKITVSTCGIPENIKRFADEKLQLRLAVSLNAADDQTRSKLMPINKKHPIGQVMDAVRYYIRNTGRRVTIEYVMLDGINDRKADLKNLITLLKGLTVNVNLIPMNPFGRQFKPSPLATVERFQKILLAEKINAVIRKSRGEDILAACGQLAGKPPPN